MRKRTYKVAALTLAAAATIAVGWATPGATLLGSERTDQTIAGSKGEMAGAGRDPSIIAGSKGDQAVARESSMASTTSDAAEQELIAGSKGDMASAGRDPS
jgi:hypothetical protein